MDSTTTWYRMPRGHLMLQSARDLATYRHAGELAERCHPRQTCVLASVPGDFDEDECVAIARAIAHSFNRIMLKDDRDRRGRDALEMPVLIAEAVLQVRPFASCGIYEDELQAVERTVDTMVEAEVVFVFAEDSDQVHDVLTQRGGVPTTREVVETPRDVGVLVPLKDTRQVQSAPPYEGRAYRGSSWIVYAGSSFQRKPKRS